VEPEEFVKLVLELHEERARDLGIIDVYAYTTVGDHIKGVGTVIVRTSDVPITINLYLLRDGSMLAITDAPGLRYVGGNAVEEIIVNDLCEPPSLAKLIQAEDPCLGEFSGHVYLCVVEELGLVNAKVCYRGPPGGIEHLASIVRNLSLASRLRGDCGVP